MTIEIERKFLVTTLPESELGSSLREEVQQGYLIVEAGREVRVRRKGQSYFFTEKKGNGLKRVENETLITERIFNALWPLTEAKRLEKTRYSFMSDGVKLELDVYSGELEPLLILEAEFITEEQAQAWSPPWFAGQEVTGDKAYKNAQLAKNGKPDNG